MEPVFYSANTKVSENVGCVALARGPIIYCAEGQDQSVPLNRLSVDVHQPVEVLTECLGAYPKLVAKGFCRPEQKALYEPVANGDREPCRITFIPYYTFANRGEDDMQVWLKRV